MDLRDLMLLMEVVRLGSAQRASRVLQLPRSTIRRRLANLEAAVGSPLLAHGVSGVELTPAGVVVVEEGRALLEHSRRMMVRATSREQRAAGTVRLVLPVGVRRDIRTWLLGQLRAANPDLRIDERECEDPLSLLHEPFDLMFYIGGPPPSGDWYSRVIARVPFRLLAAPSYIERAGAPKDLSELAAHPIVAWRGGGRNPEVLPLLAGGAVPVHPWFVSGNLEFVMNTVAQGMGIGLGPVFMDSDGLVPCLADVVGADQTVRTLSPHSTSSDARVRALQESINQFFAALPDL